MPLRSIITGFDAFGGESFNVSQLAVERLPDKINGEGGKSISVTKKILATCCDESWSQLEGLLPAKDEPDTFLLMSGLASKRNRISLERFALNIKDYRIADNKGHQPLDEPIIQSGPEARKTVVKLRGLLESLTGAGYLCEISNFAGAFVCNEVYYRCLSHQEDHSNLTGVLFVHLPSPVEYAQELASVNQLTEPPHEDAVISIYASLLQDIARYCCRDMILGTRAQQG